MSQNGLSCRLRRFLDRFFWISSLVSGSFAPPLSLSPWPLPFLRFACLVVRVWGRTHGVHGPTLRLYRPSGPKQGPGLQDWNSVRLGQPAPPKSGGTRTLRTLFLRPVPHVLEQEVHGEYSVTTQSWGQGIKQACSRRGLGSKYSQMASSAGDPSDLSMQPTSRVWMPSSPPLHVNCRGVPKVLADTGTHSFQAPSFQSYRSLCQSHTRKQFLWLEGRWPWSQLVWRVVQPSTWAHQTARLWLPPGPQSLPMHLPHGPGEQTNKISHSEEKGSMYSISVF